MKFLYIVLIHKKCDPPISDPLASIIISLFIIKITFEIFKDSIDKMVDKSCDNDLEDAMKLLALEQDGVIEIQSMKTRMFGNIAYLDLKIIADGEKTLRKGQVIAKTVHDKREDEFDLIKHVNVNVKPN